MQLTSSRNHEQRGTLPVNTSSPTAKPRGCTRFWCGAWHKSGWCAGWAVLQLPGKRMEVEWKSRRLEEEEEGRETAMSYRGYFYVCVCVFFFFAIM